MISAASLLPSRVLPIQRTKFLKISSVGAQTRMASSANNVMYSSPKELWQGILERYDAAQAAKASTLTDTNTEVITDGGIGFILKIATTLRDKPKAPAAGGNAPKAEWRNPFLPPDPDLFVCHLSTTHSLVLNKFNIVPHHALVITREFHLQEEPLNAADFEATWTVMQVSSNP